MTRRYPYLTEDAERRTVLVQQKLLTALSDTDAVSAGAIESVASESNAQMLQWRPRTAQRAYAMAAAVGGSDFKEFHIDPNGTISMNVVWTPRNIKLTWTVANFHEPARIVLTFRMPGSGVLLAPPQDIGDLGDGEWDGAADELGFIPTEGWELAISLVRQ